MGRKNTAMHRTRTEEKNVVLDRITLRKPQIYVTKGSFEMESTGSLKERKDLKASYGVEIKSQ